MWKSVNLQQVQLLNLLTLYVTPTKSESKQLLKEGKPISSPADILLYRKVDLKDVVVSKEI